MKKRLKLKITGDVQGVGFRFHTIEIARDQGLTGFVKNDSNGTVSVVAEGEEENLQHLLSWCQKGPPLAKVEKVEAVWEEYRDSSSSFEVER